MTGGSVLVMFQVKEVVIEMGRARAKAKSARIRRRPKTEAELIAEKAAEIGVPAAQIARGGFERFDVKLGRGEKVQTTVTLINRGGTPVDRWKRDGQLSETQVRAIEYVQGLWERAGTVRGLVADHLRVPGGSGKSGLSQQEALDDLATFKERVPAKYWSVFENVCRFDEAAGTAGSNLATNSRSAIDAARVCVCFVADLVAMWRGL